MTRAALTVTSSGSPGPSPTPHSVPCWLASFAVARDRIDGGGGHRAAAAAAGHHQIGHPARAVDELLLGLRRADETDRPAQHRGRAPARRRRSSSSSRNSAVARCRSPAPRRPADRPTARRRPPSGCCRLRRPARRARDRRPGTPPHCRRAAGRGDPGGDHRRIAQHRGAPEQRGVARVDDVVGVGDMLGDVDLSAGVDQPDDHPRDIVGKRVRSARRGSSRTTADRSRRRRGCSRAPAHPTGEVLRLAGLPQLAQSDRRHDR